MRINEIISEALPTTARAPLYHATGLYNAHHILSQGAILPGNDGYVSTTRDARLNYVAYEAMYQPQVTFVIDQSQLRARNRSQPYSWAGQWILDPDFDPEEAGDPDSDAHRKESEERVHGPIPLRAVERITIRPYRELRPQDQADIQQFQHKCRSLHIPVQFIPRPIA